MGAKTNTVNYNQGPSTVNLFGKMEEDEDTSPLQTPRNVVHVLPTYDDSNPSSFNQFSEFDTVRTDIDTDEVIVTLNETIQAKEKEIEQLKETETKIIEKHTIEMQEMKNEIVSIKQKLMKAQTDAVKQHRLENGNHRHGN